MYISDYISNNQSTIDWRFKKIHCLTGEFHSKFNVKNWHRMNCTQSDEHNIGFLSEIYCGIHQLSNDFLELHDQA